jgi:hypothetical protein
MLRPLRSDSHNSPSEIPGTIHHSLVNRTTHQALFAERDDHTRVWSGRSMELAASAFTLVRRLLTFQSPPGSNGPTLDPV